MSVGIGLLVGALVGALVGLALARTGWRHAFRPSARPLLLAALVEPDVRRLLWASDQPTVHPHVARIVRRAVVVACASGHAGDGARQAELLSRAAAALADPATADALDALTRSTFHALPRRFDRDTLV